MNRHLTSARSDISASRQIDVWKARGSGPVPWTRHINPLEDALFHEFQAKSASMNGKAPRTPVTPFVAPRPEQTVQVMTDAEIAEKRDPALRLPRQAEHHSQIVGHFLAVKNSKEIAGAIQAHFDRLQKYRKELLGLATDIEGDAGSDR